MSDGAFVTTLPKHFSALSKGVEAHVPETPVNRLARGGLLILLGWAESMALTLVATTPAPPAQQQFHAPLGDRSAVVEEPCVPRRLGHDPRLPGRRPHP
ncbi:hypothetical protein ABIE45_002808 [Methylobacterium sp. OAE515]|uniref:hypothetical protein n=1 Tax=Methylobacterium sp. OAE515 TaxID=2817895 RepID=UPI001789E318